MFLVMLQLVQREPNMMDETVEPTEIKGWCGVSTCELRAVPQDCIRLGPVTVCKPCLVYLGDGVQRDDLNTAEEHIQSLEEQVEHLEEKLDAG